MTSSTSLCRALGFAAVLFWSAVSAAEQSETSDAEKPSAADRPALGLFEGQSDVGSVKLTGEASYDVTRQTYHVAGAGTNMWFGADEFHWVWKRLEGDFILRTRARFIGEGVEAHRKLGWTVRSTTGSSGPPRCTRSATSTTTT